MENNMMLQNKTRFLILFLFLPLWNLHAFPECDIRLQWSEENGPALKGILHYRPDRSGVEGFYTEGLQIHSLSGEPVSSRDGLMFFSIEPEKELQFQFQISLKQKEEEESSIYSLLQGWYPVPESRCNYTLSLDLPERIIPLSEGEQTVKKESDSGEHFQFTAPHSLDRIHLILSSEFQVKKSRYRDIEIVTYFTKENSSFAETYLQQATRYIQRFEKENGKFPYSRFSMVESNESVGMSMPTFTLLGSRLISMPFLIEQSLGHEIYHQWFGNYVSPRQDTGNWCEGLTNLMADGSFAEERGEALDFRKNSLLQLSSYVNSQNDFPLRDFEARYDRRSQAIGYSRGAMFFYMLRNRIGKHAFQSGLRGLLKEFGGGPATWSDLRQSFEKSSGENLAHFFETWLDHTGMPALTLTDVRTTREASGYRTHIRIQSDRFLDRVPLSIRMQGTGESSGRRISFKGTEQTYDFLTSFAPDRALLDPGMEIIRKLSRREMPPTLSRLFGSEHILFIVDRPHLSFYSPLYELYFGADAKVIPPDQIQGEDLKGKDLVFLDGANPAALPPYDFPGIDSHVKAQFVVRNSPWDPEHIVARIHAESPSDLRTTLSRVQHYGKYQEVSFLMEGRRVETVEPESIFGLSQIVIQTGEQLQTDSAAFWSGIRKQFDHSPEKILYVGEQHNLMGHHRIQLRAIETLYENGKSLSIGMEMFLEKDQQELDRFIDGKISEQELLVRTDYFDTWGYDYALYRPILLFARENRIPVIGLNTDRSMVRKVSQLGIHGIPNGNLLPEGMDFTNPDYRSFLREIYTTHMGTNPDGFENFFQAQVLWDETMASGISRRLELHPEETMVVLAGNGHLMYRWGIPDRVERRTGIHGYVILNGEKPDPGKGDAYLQTIPEEVPPSPSLGVVIDRTSSGLQIQKIMDESVAAGAGFQPGDRIISVDNNPVESMSQLRAALFFLKWNRKTPIVVIRNNQEVEIPVSFPNPESQNPAN